MIKRELESMDRAMAIGQKTVVVCLARLASLLVLSCAAVADAQQAGAGVPAAQRVVYDRTDDCVKCHEHFPVPNDFVDDIPGSRWEKEDKHRRSFALLEENKPLVTQILGFDLQSVLRDGQLSTEPNDRAHADLVKQCLRCHATWPKNDPAWPEDKPGPPVDLSFGVSCQACHGPGLNWSRPHREQWWRLCTPSSKKRLGLTDLRHPVRRALLCASCHVGNLDEGKFVTHEMYAAGHPPLPSFEFAAFSSQMPAHWRSLHEKGNFRGRDEVPANFDMGNDLRGNFGIRDDDMKRSYREANFSDVKHDPFADLASTQGALISGLVVMRDYLKLIQAGFAEGNSVRPPEFALFDCAACHHELQSGSGTARRPVRASPAGRPPLQAWPTTLARAGLVQVAGDETQRTTLLTEFDQMWRVVELAATQRPFGDPAKIRAASQNLTNWLEPKIVQISRQPMDQAAAERAWRFFTDPARVAIHDYHAARQTAWALSAISKDVGRGNAANELFFPKGNDRLKLTLPAKQSGKVLDNLKDSLSAIEEYDSVWFESVLVKLRPK